MGRNPKTGADAPIPPRRVFVFKPSAILKQQVNGKRSSNAAPAAIAEPHVEASAPS